ncbi:MAG: hypothetical protein U0325_16415 [Polyangiales bacterium]
MSRLPPPPPVLREVMPSNLPPAMSLRAPAPPRDDGPLPTVVALIEHNEWSKVCAQLEPLRDALPATSPSLGLLYAVARHEEALSHSGKREVRDPETERLARESLALLLDVGRDTAVARLLALRLLRRPASATPAPSARVSAVIVFVAIALGALVGWLLDEGFDRILRR